MPTTRRGFALPMIIIAIALITVALGAAFASVGIERRVTNDHKAQLAALALAETGLERFLANRRALGFSASPPPDSESISFTLNGGYADVVMRRVRNGGAVDRSVYLARARGVYTVPGAAGAPEAVRTVAQYVTWRRVPMQLLAGFSSLAGVLKNGGSGAMSGLDMCGLADTLAGVAVPRIPGYIQTGGGLVPRGTPDTLNIGGDPRDSVKIDWNGIVNGEVVTPTLTVPPGNFPNPSAFNDPNYWPTIKVLGDFTLPHDGRGLLIVTGNFSVSGNKSWTGPVLIGGALKMGGSSQIEGAVVSGLNAKLGFPVDLNDIGNGNIRIRFNSCALARALEGIALQVYPNAWFDNWAMY